MRKFYTVKSQHDAIYQFIVADNDDQVHEILKRTWDDEAGTYFWDEGEAVEEYQIELLCQFINIEFFIE